MEIGINMALNREAEKTGPDAKKRQGLFDWNSVSPELPKSEISTNLKPIIRHWAFVGRDPRAAPGNRQDRASFLDKISP